MVKKLIAFDLDGTLTPSKQPFRPEMAELFNELLTRYHVCVVSGGKYEQFEKQFLTHITRDSELLKRLHLLPTSGTRYHKFLDGRWQMMYSNDFSEGQRKKIINALEESYDESGYREAYSYGDVIEDRGGQITLSALGQEVGAQLGDAATELKRAWDPDRKKCMKIRNLAQERLPEFSVSVAGTTSVDVVRPGTDKAYGITKLMKITGFTKQDILFMGDSIFPGGNDYAVEEMGVDCIAVRDWEDTTFAIKGILGVS